MKNYIKLDFKVKVHEHDDLHEVHWEIQTNCIVAYYLNDDVDMLPEIVARAYDKYALIDKFDRELFIKNEAPFKEYHFDQHSTNFKRAIYQMKNPFAVGNTERIRKKVYKEYERMREK